MTEPPLRVWLLSDGRPGHYNQSRGILKALARRRPLTVDWIELELRAGFLRTPLRALLNARAAPSLRWLRLFYRLSLPPQPPQMIVSAGGRTSFANAWLAARFGVPNLFAGSLRGLSPERFRAVLTLEPIGAANNIVLVVPPSAIDADDPEAGAVPGCAAETPCWALLIGGDGAGYRYTRQDWMVLAGLLGRLAAHYRVRWLISSSPRTGVAAERLLRAHLPAACIAEAAWYGEDRRSRVARQLGAAERVFVSEDSMTLLTEAISARKPVCSLRPQRARPEPRYGEALQRFAGRALIHRFAIDALCDEPQRLASLQWRLLDEAPSETLARALQGLIGELR